MADTNLLVLAREYKKLREEVKKVLSMPKGDKGDPGEKGEKGDKGDTGPQGFPGRDGKDGVNGFNGQDGRDGVDGKDGKDGLDGVGVQNAYIDFDNSLVIVLSDGTEINAGFLSQEAKENVVATFKQGAQTLNELLPVQTGNAGKFLKTDGTDVSWDTLDGSDINLSSPPVIGNTTPNAATFTTLTATGQTDLGTGSAQFIRAVGGATTPTLSAQGSGTNVGLNLTTKGTGAISLQTGNGEQVRVGDTFGGGVATNYWLLQGRASAQPLLSVAGADANITAAFSSKGSGAISLNTNAGAQQQFAITHTASAVNYVQVTGAATGGNPQLSVQGSDANPNFDIYAKGSGVVRMMPSVLFGRNSANYFRADGAAAGSAPVLSVTGSDTNIDLALTPKGTGNVRFGTYTANMALTVQGYIEIKDSGGTIRKLAVIS